MLRGGWQSPLSTLCRSVNREVLESVNVFEFAGRYKPLNEKFRQFDAYVTGRASTKLMQAISKVGRRNHYDMVLRKKDVVMYRNRTTIADITSLVKAEIRDYL